MKLAAGIAAAVLLWGALAWLAHRSIYFPVRYPQGFWDQQSALGARDVWLTASDGVRLHAWWKPVPGATLATLFLHGNAGNLSHRGYAFEALAAAGSSALVLDYRGYGRSEGTPTEAGLYRDAETAWQWLRTQAPAIVIHGESLGSAVAVELASRHPSAGLVLQAPFSSARDAAASVIPGLGPLLVWGFDSTSRIPHIRAPLLILHGSRDEVIPIALGRKLFAAAAQPKQFWEVPGATHNDLPDAPGYTTRLRDFYRTLPTSGAP